MAKRSVVAGVLVAVAAAAVAAAYQDPGEQAPDPSPEAEGGIAADVIMPTKVSRPGCEETDSCYVPARITVRPGQPVTWLNQDSAFHSVTSGAYGDPTDDFDSGYMDPYESFTLTFERAGTVDYFCTLHPWMEGQVVVRE